MVTVLGAEATPGAPEFRWGPEGRRPERPPVRKAVEWLARGRHHRSLLLKNEALVCKYINRDAFVHGDIFSR